MQRHWKRLAIIATTLGSVAAGAALWWNLRPLHFYTDAGTIRQPRTAVTPRDVLWTPPAPLEELIGTQHQDYEPRLSWDGLTLCFVRGKAGENADIYIRQRTPSGWTPPRPLDGVNTEYDELGPEPSGDGQRLYFYSDRPGGRGGYDLWVVHRSPDSDSATGSGWQEPINLGPAVNSEFNDYGPSIARDGHTLYFASNRPRPADAKQPDPHAWPATLREDFFHRPYDLYMSPVSDAGYGDALELTPLNSPQNEGAPCISPAGDFLYFASDRPGGAGGFDLYRARLLHDQFQTPLPLGEALNTPANELDPGLAQLGFALYFSSDRGPQAAIEPGKEAARTSYALYYSVSREVFSTSEARTPIDWAALWAAILPNLMWLLLALLLLLLALALLRDMKNRKLSLLARCLLLSLLLHSLLLALLSFWRVTAAIGDTLRRSGGGVQIAMGSPSHGDSLAVQIRGQLTHAPPVAAQAIEVPQALLDAAPPPPLETASLSVPPIATVSEPPRAMHEAREAAPEIAAAPPAAPPPPPAFSPIELATPSTASPQAQTETQMAAPTAPASLVSARLTIPTSQPAFEDIPVAVEPHGGQRANFAQAPSRAAEELKSTRDAPAPQSAGSNVFADRQALAGAPAPLDLPLPSGQPLAPQPVNEATGPAAPAVATASEQSRPATAAMLDTPGTGTSSQVEITPVGATASVASGAAGSPSPAAATASDAPASATPAPIRIDASAKTVGSSAIAATLPLGLPQATSAAGSGSPGTSEEPGPRPSLAAGMSPGTRAALGGVAPSGGNAPAGLVQLKPESSGGGGAALDRAAPNSSAIAARDADARRGASPAAAPSPLAGSGAAPNLPVLALSLPSDTGNAPGGPGDGKHGGQAGDGPGGMGLSPAAVTGDAFDAARNPIGMLIGRVIDAKTGQPLAEASVRLDLPNEEALVASTDGEGRYRLAVPNLPDFFALSAGMDGYVPASANLPGSGLEGRSLRQDFALYPGDPGVIAIEDEPTVHHLGNDAFEGSINSQFQRGSEGRALVAQFQLASNQAGTNVVDAAVHLMAKGVQCPPHVRINNRQVNARMSESPDDGGFGEYRLRFDPSWLKAGANTVEIRSTNCRGDLDDFEFVNVQIRLRFTEEEP